MIVLLGVAALMQTAARAQWPMQRGFAVGTCFSGGVGGSNPNGIVLAVMDVRAADAQPLDQNWFPLAGGTFPGTLAAYHGPADISGKNLWTNGNLGEVFGVALDNDGNIYTTSTVIYGGTSATTNYPRSTNPAFIPPAGYAEGNGYGNVYRIDRTTGAVSLFAQLPNGNNPLANIPYPGLGNICYDSRHNQFYVTDLDDGKIYILHGTGPTATVIPGEEFDPFGSDPGASSPGFAPLGERLWGVAYRNDSVYYCRWRQDEGNSTNPPNEIWAVGISAGGTFVPVSNHKIFEPSVPDANGAVVPMVNPISDIEFSTSGEMLLVQRVWRGTAAAPLQASLGTWAHNASMARWRYNGAQWTRSSTHWDIGRHASRTNAAGGCDWGYTGNAEGKNIACDSAVWVSADAIHLQAPYTPSQGLVVYGWERMNINGVTYPNPSIVPIDADGNTTFNEKTEIGDIDIFRYVCGVPEGGCGNSECKVSSVKLNTGYDHAAGGAYTPTTPDGYWQLVTAPNVGLTLPTPAWVIASIPGWATLAGSQWISAYNFAGYTVNNPAPENAYGFQRCFCTCDSTDIRIQLQVLVDNDADVFFNGVRIGGVAVSNTTANFHLPGLLIDTVIRNVPGGRQCLRIDVRNISGVAMGLNVVGTATSLPGPGRPVVPLFLTPACCDPRGTILGRKIWDKNCDGKNDNTPDNAFAEPGLAGWQITLNPGNITTTTDANGFYYFNNLTPGVYTITEAAQPGWQQSAPGGNGAYSVTLGPNGVAERNFLNCRKAPCDEISRGVLDTNCCQYSFSISNAQPDITRVTYAVSGGTIESITASPCAFTTLPAQLFGSTSGSLNFSAPCNSTIALQVEATPTTATGIITITWVVYHKNGDSCAYTTSYTCRRAALTHCDSVRVVPFLFAGLDLSGRTLTIINQKVPPSPICGVDISFVNPPSIPWAGGGLTVDGNARSWSAPYQTISLAPPANSTLQFNLGVDYTIGWSGQVRLKVRHCDGDTCEWLMPSRWLAVRPGRGGVTIGSEQISGRMWGLTSNIRLGGLDTTRIAHIVVEVDSTYRLFGGSGGHWRGTEREHAAGYQNIASFNYADTKGLFSLTNPTLEPTMINLVVAANDTGNTTPPLVTWTAYDANANPIGSDTLRATTRLLEVVPYASVRAGGVQLLGIQPNPSKDDIDIRFLLESAGNVRIDLVSETGIDIARIADGYRSAGLNMVHYSVRTIPSGRYMVRLASNGITSIMPAVIVR